MQPERPLPRLTPDLFRLPIEKIRAGYKSDTYFNRTRTILRSAGRSHSVEVQLFQKEAGAMVCGIDQVLAILHAGTGRELTEPAPSGAETAGSCAPAGGRSALSSSGDPPASAASR